MDMGLSVEEIKKMFKSVNTRIYSDSYIKFNQAKLQKQILDYPLSGIEIGNFSLKNKNTGKLVESPKFLEILRYMQVKIGQVAVYSNFFENGIVLFSEFLDRHGF